jgi:hypothetical protein
MAARKKREAQEEAGRRLEADQEAALQKRGADVAARFCPGRRRGQDE